ncbi:MAG: NIL domain-containing protein [Chloroflexi bacterium]|nr:NIL domain-containing protein [Chloroflexota bacterium]MCY3938589.1 NIL domain-containing protein [Chloroflexota bacterium]MCY4108041.1 NIL domain-containing protein [Chloroflexota bacterium]
MARARVKFTYPTSKIQEPIIYKVSRDFELVSNIRRAEVTDKVGWVVLELEGEQDAIDAALDWVRGQEVRVDPVEGDVVH